MSKISFARVSTQDQELTLQLKQLEEADSEEISYGKKSGVSTDNEHHLSEILKYIR